MKILVAELKRTLKKTIHAESGNDPPNRVNSSLSTKEGGYFKNEDSGN